MERERERARAFRAPAQTRKWRKERGETRCMRTTIFYVDTTIYIGAHPSNSGLTLIESARNKPRKPPDLDNPHHEATGQTKKTFCKPNKKKNNQGGMYSLHQKNYLLKVLCLTIFLNTQIKSYNYINYVSLTLQ